MSKIITAITEWFRALLWSIAEIFLFLLDCLWKVVLKIGTLNIGGSKVTTQFFSVMSVCMLLFIVFKIVKIYIKFFVDNDYREKINLSKVLISLSLASTLISGLPLGYRIICNISNEAIEHVNYWIPSDYLTDYKNVDEINMSDVLLQAGRVNISNREKDLGENIELNDDFDINETYQTEDYINDFFNDVSVLDEETMTSENASDMMKSIAGIIGYGSKTYKYFPTWSSIILEILLSIVSLFIFALTAIQIAMRSIICSMKYLLAPYMVATIIDPEDNSFGTWVRSIAGDLIANFCQIYFTYFVLILCNSSSIQTALGNNWSGIFAQIALFIGGLLAIQEIPNVISQYFGSSGQSMMETMRGTMMLGSMLSVTGGTALKGAVITAKAGKSAVNNASSAKDAYTSGGGGINGLKNVERNFASEFNKKNNSQNNGGVYSDVKDNTEPQQFKENQHSSPLEEEDSMNPSGQTKQTFTNRTKDVMNPFEDNGDETYKSPDYQKNDDYDSYLSAAKYYGIENAETMDKDELKNELGIRGYKYTSMKNYKSSFNSESYKTNMKNIKNKKGKNIK